MAVKGDNRILGTRELKFSIGVLELSICLNKLDFCDNKSTGKELEKMNYLF